MGRQPNVNGTLNREPPQIVKGWGVPSLSFWDHIMKGWGVQPLSLEPSKEGNPEIGRQPNVNGTFYKQNLVTENQLSDSWKEQRHIAKGWGVRSLSFWGAAANREGLESPVLVLLGGYSKS